MQRAALLKAASQKISCLECIGTISFKDPSMIFLRIRIPYISLHLFTEEGFLSPFSPLEGSSIGTAQNKRRECLQRKIVGVYKYIFVSFVHVFVVSQSSRSSRVNICFILGTHTHMLSPPPRIHTHPQMGNERHPPTHTHTHTHTHTQR